MKIVKFKGEDFKIKDPTILVFETDFDKQLYSFIYDEITNGQSYEPIINSDNFFDNTYTIDVLSLFEASSLSLPKNGPSKKATNRRRLKLQFIVRDFLFRHPILLGLVENNVFLADAVIKNAEILYREDVKATNFIKIKSIIDQLNRKAWSRDRDRSENQSGVSTLGTISETLIKRVLTDLVDDQIFFQVSTSEVQSYGDFVLMCLPNNLWLSVKSNFARERLLASGYSNDILGVGFFQDSHEFTSLVRIRNLQRAGFLAMYCPDVAVSQLQIDDDSNTYDEVISHYKRADITLPTNINGKPFIRRLSNLVDDLTPLVEESNVKKRMCVKF